MLLIKHLLNVFKDFGFTHDEFLTTAYPPEQRVYSTKVYLQIATDESVEILLINLQEFNQFVTAVVRVQ